MIIGFEDVVDENDDELDMLETESKEEVKAEENAAFTSSLVSAAAFTSAAFVSFPCFFSALSASPP